MCSLNAGRHEVGAHSHLCFPGNKLLNVGDQLGYVLPEMMIVLHLPLAMVRSIHIPEKTIKISLHANYRGNNSLKAKLGIPSLC